MKPRPIENPKNPWASNSLEYLEDVPVARPQFLEDGSKSIISKNDSPDLSFEFSVNPYRGCGHACAYCYARPTHEYLGFGAGSDFDTKIVTKTRAPELLRQEFNRKSWRGDLVMFSGVTDCYQPAEASLRLTRQCLEVCAEFRNPVALITKSPLVERDLDVLLRLHRDAAVSVAISVPIWDEKLARAIEPGVATPRRRLETIRRLSDAGLRVAVMVAPIIPAVSDEGLATVLEEARAAGAVAAGYVLLRLPGSLQEVFERRIREALPQRDEKILHRIRQTRGGALYQSRFGVRGRGEGAYADAIASVFKTTAARLGLVTGEPPAAPKTFVRPEPVQPQLTLF